VRALQPSGDTEIFFLKDGARPPSEAELRKKLTPGERWQGTTPLCCWFHHIPASARPTGCVGIRAGCSANVCCPPAHPPAHLAPCPPDCPAEEACTLEACYVAAFRMKQRGMVMHDKLDKAAVSWRHLYCDLSCRLLPCSACSSECTRGKRLCVEKLACGWPLPAVQGWFDGACQVLLCLLSAGAAQCC
jgi:hypothetical protein